MRDLSGFVQCIDVRRYQGSIADCSCLKFKFRDNPKLFFYATRFRQNIGFGDFYQNNTIFTTEDKSTFLVTSTNNYEGIEEEEFIQLILKKKKDLDLVEYDFELPEGFRAIEISPFYMKRDNRYREKLLDILN